MSGNKLHFILLAVLVVVGLSDCGVNKVDAPVAGGGSGGSISSSAQLQTVEITPTNPTIAKDTSLQLTATGIYSDSTTQDLSDAVTWSTSDPAVVTVSVVALTAEQIRRASGTSRGRAYAYGKSCGKATIKAQSGDKSGTTTITVACTSLVSIDVTPAHQSIAKGTKEQFVATGTFSDNTTQDITSTATWASSNPGVATIDADGLATTLGAGTTTITVTSGTVSGSATLSVTPVTLSSLSVTPANRSVANGTPVQFTATGTYSDNSTQDLTASVSWSSSNTAAATISDSGLAATLAAGSTTITAALGSTSGSTTLTVTPATLSSISVSPTNPTNASGTTRQFTATGTYSDGSTQVLTTSVTWSSSNTGAATISNASGSKGLASCLAAGTSTIRATSGSVSASTTLTVNPATLSSLSISPTNPTNASGTTRQFTATGTYSDGSTQVLTTSVTWNSSNTAAATISNARGSNGLASCLGAGTSTIRATSGSVSASTTLTVNPATLLSIAVTPANPSIASGSTQQFSASGTYSDGTTQNLTTSVTWNSSDTGVATVSNAAGSKGLASGAAAGTATITATSGSIAGSTTLTVTPPQTMGSATLSWVAPATYTDGSQLTDLAGFKVYYGTSSGNYTKVINVGNVSSYTVNNLAPGSTYFFAVTAYDASNIESNYSGEASKSIP